MLSKMTRKYNSATYTKESQSTMRESFESI
jgi:hypothetical protein